MNLNSLISALFWIKIYYIICFIKSGTGNPFNLQEQWETIVWTMDYMDAQKEDPICHPNIRKIYYSIPSSRLHYFSCMAVLISQRKAITVAQCFNSFTIYQDNPNSVKFYTTAYEEDVADGYYIPLRASRIFFKPLLFHAETSVQILNDFAFVELNRELTRDVINVKNLDLNSNSGIVKSDCKIIATAPLDIDCFTVPFYTMEVKVISMPKYFLDDMSADISPHIIVPLITDTNGKFKRVPAGSPLMCHGELIGLASFAYTEKHVPQFFIQPYYFKTYYDVPPRNSRGFYGPLSEE